MLRSLEIRNYRNLRHLTIEKLGRVNLLVGKNNTGKTSVLEAVAIYASNRDELLTIKLLLQRRGEHYINSKAGTPMGEGEPSILRNNLDSLSSLFYDYKPIYFPLDDHYSDIDISESIDALPFDNPPVSIGIRKSYRTLQKDKSGRDAIEYIVADSEEELEHKSFRYEIKFWRNHIQEITYPLNNDLLFVESSPRYAPAQFQYVDSKNQTQQPIEILYGRIALSEKEDSIVNALKIIEPRTEDFRIIEDGRTIIRLNNGERRNLSSMGDGVSRVFSIILSMVNCEGTYLLIDEFENGLHYSVQEKLWEIIFYLAERLNIQVFATTHSNDTIKAFGEVVNSKLEYSDAQLIRLRNIKGDISAVLFNAHDIEVANETDYIDLR